MNPAIEIESVARSYLVGERTLSELEDWLAPNLQFLFQLDASAFASRLAARIEGAIADMDAENLGEDHVRDSIRELLSAQSLANRLIVATLGSDPNDVADTAFSSNSSKDPIPVAVA